MKQSKHYYTPIITTIFLLLSGHGVWGQLSITSTGTAYTQDFDGMGSSSFATLPTGFKVNGDGAAPSWSTGTTSTTRAAGTSGTNLLSGTSSGGVYNFANGVTASAPDRALGFLTSGSFASPNSIIFRFTNNTGITVTNLNISFDYEKYRAGTRAWNLTFFHGNNSNPTIAETNGDQSYAVDGANAVVNPSSSINKTISLTGLSIANGTDYYIKWTSTGLAGSTNSQGIALDNFSITASAPLSNLTWTGSTSTDWNTASNWNPAAVPTSSSNVIIPSSGITNFPVVSGLTIDAGKTVTLNANTRLTVNGNILNNGTLTLESGATLVQGTGNTVTGSGIFNVKQALTGAGGATPSDRHWYLGSPVSLATSNVFNAAGDNRLWTYSETALAYNTEINDNTTTLSPMQGCVVRLGANETSVFTGGLLNTGDYTSSLTRTGTTDSKRGYTLLSNPYPSYLDWTAAFTAAAATNANISSSIWYRSHNSTSNTMVFDIFNASSSVATTNSSGTTTQYIPPMQAFWVYNPNDGTTGSLTFSNSMRSHQSNGGLKSSTDFPAFVRLNLENDGAIDQTVLYFDNNAAAGYDNFDSDKMMLANAAQVYSFVDNKKLAINGMKSIKANKQVPLTVEFPTAKGYSFNATEVVMTDGIVILEDRLTKVFQDLTMNPVYNFDAAAGTDANRFVVHFQANGGVAGIETAEDNGIAIVSNASGLVTITLSEELPAMGTIQIIDINGKVIATQAINEQTTKMNINAATGVYHVLVDSASKVARKKIVITK